MLEPEELIECPLLVISLLSNIVDKPTAQIISKEVSDGVIAPGYSEEALELLKKKKNGKYCILQIDPNYNPENLESRQVYGITLQQKETTLFSKVLHSKKLCPKTRI